jgi:hypothetical protein
MELLDEWDGRFPSFNRAGRVMGLPYLASHMTSSCTPEYVQSTVVYEAQKGSFFKGDFH